MRRFDKFKYYFDHKNEYEDEGDLSVMFYWHYVKPFGYDFIEEYVCTISRLVHQDFQRVLKKSEEYEKGWRQLFREMCDELKMQKDVSKITELVPFDWFNVKNMGSVRKVRGKLCA